MLSIVAFCPRTAHQELPTNVSKLLTTRWWSFMDGDFMIMVLKFPPKINNSYLGSFSLNSFDSLVVRYEFNPSLKRLKEASLTGRRRGSFSITDVKVQNWIVVYPRVCDKNIPSLSPAHCHYLSKHWRAKQGGIVNIPIVLSAHPALG